VKLSVVGAVAVASVVALAGCAPETAPVLAGPAEPLVDGCAPGGETVENVVVSTDLAQAPDVEYQAPVAVETTQRLVVVEGTGEVVANADQVLISYALYNGGTGDMLGFIGYDGEGPVPFPVDSASPMLQGVSYTLLCTKVGSRVVGVIPASQAYGDEGAPQFGLEPGAPVIFVADIQSILPPPEPPLERLTGVIKDAPEGFPEISYAMSGEPTVTVDTENVTRDFQMARVIDGDGQEVFAGATVIVHYQGVNMNTGKVFDSSWERGEPSPFPTSGVVPGFRDGLVGQKVGSRVLIIIPPALGYGPRGGLPEAEIGPDDTIFFVVDILGVR
jgi:peptidylprolyl isomerase